MAIEKKTTYDIDGSDIITSVLQELLNECPALLDRKISFATLDTSSATAFFPSSGSAIISHKEDVTGHVTQVCAYPFVIVHRTAPKTEDQRLKAKEFLDTIGRWLEQQPITIGGVEYQLSDYPDLSQNGREIKYIRRTSPAAINAVYDDGTEDWTISISLNYENNFYN